MKLGTPLRQGDHMFMNYLFRYKLKLTTFTYTFLGPLPPYARFVPQAKLNYSIVTSQVVNGIEVDIDNTKGGIRWSLIIVSKRVDVAGVI